MRPDSSFNLVTNFLQQEAFSANALYKELEGLRGGGHRINCGGQDWVGGDGGPIIPIVKGPTTDEQASPNFYGGIGRNLKCQIMKIH